MASCVVSGMGMDLGRFRFRGVGENRFVVAVAVVKAIDHCLGDIQIRLQRQGFVEVAHCPGPVSVLEQDITDVVMGLSIAYGTDEVGKRLIGSPERASATPSRN